MFITAGMYYFILEPNVDGYELEPKSLQELDGYKILQTALGPKHSLLLTDRGLVSMGSNVCGQLGRNTPAMAGMPVWPPLVYAHSKYN